MHLVEIGVVDQRYQAVMAVLQDGWKVSVRRRRDAARDLQPPERSPVPNDDLDPDLDF